MNAVELRFQSPTKLNEAKETLSEEKPIWVHATCKKNEEKIPLKLSPTEWIIYCSICDGKARINDWEVDESNYSMKIKQETIKGNFNQLDYPFSVSMIGQVLPTRDLVNYLKQVQDIYHIPEKEEKQPKKEPEYKEPPTDHKG